MRNSSGTIQVVVVVAGALVLGALGCAQPKIPTPVAPVSSSSAPVAAPVAPRSLYERLGGKPAIEAVVDRFIQNVAGDDRVNHRFTFTDIPRFRGHLVDQVCAATGGPCTYAGRTMLAAHKGQRIDEAAWSAVVEDLIAALDHFHVPAAEKAELLGALGSMHNDIVEVAP